ncbi:MAG: hypothetical protein EHM59_15970 [Betaproteobacteria bacterium]|nr:MAG: hypothetical protein EHM59_15970 [Betaproteobacteria bacterium]
MTESSDIGAGVFIEDATIGDSVIRSKTVLEEDVVIEDSVVLDSWLIGAGARIGRAMIDHHATLAAGTRIGCADEPGGARTATPPGIVVAPLETLDERRRRLDP